MADGTAKKCGRVGSCHIYSSLTITIVRLFCALTWKMTFEIKAASLRSRQLLVYTFQTLATQETYLAIRGRVPNTSPVANAEMKKSRINGSGTKVSNRQNGFTRADTLGGMLSSARTCYDVNFYHPDVAVDLQDQSVKGSNLISFKAVTSFQIMQVALFDNLQINSIIHQNVVRQYLHYTTLPTLHVKFKPLANDFEVTFRCEADVKNSECR
jgi:hypothetical protein